MAFYIGICNPATISSCILCICDVNSGYLHTKQTEISQKLSEQTKIFKISYYIISEVLMNEMIKIIEVRCTLTVTTVAWTHALSEDSASLLFWQY
jgi:hypothetical protein